MADVDNRNWRVNLPPGSRTRIVNKISETLTRHIPSDGVPDTLQEIRRIAARFEEKMYAAAQSQSDYLRRISLKMLTMESMGTGSNGSSGGNSFNAPPYDEY